MKILCIASEAEPYVKTGGLAAVAGALPRALRARGHDARVVIPFYSAIDTRRHPAEMILEDLPVDLPAGRRNFSVWSPVSEHGGVPYYFLKHDDFFARGGIYDEHGSEYADNPLRYGYFCMAVFRMLKALGWRPDVFHCHDWQSGLVPVYLQNHPSLAHDLDFARSAIMFTIHNLAYQGIYPSSFMPLLDIDWRLFHPGGMEFYGSMNLLKGGVTHSDVITTVSRRYAREILTPEYGCGLEGMLKARWGDLYGIMNGIDEEVWDPAKDPYLDHHFDANDLSGKARGKDSLQRRLGLAPDPRRPLASIVSRLVDQKGLDLIIAAAPALLATGLQLAVHGTGWRRYEDFFRDLARDHPDQVSARIGYEDELSHRIVAASDMTLMPSRFEPCGLGQLYGMRYGAVPVVHATGGLADSVIHATPDGVATGASTGFVFHRYAPSELLNAAHQALHCYHEKPATWRRLVSNGMRKDFSWNRSAEEYEGLMRRITTIPQ